MTKTRVKITREEQILLDLKTAFELRFEKVDICGYVEFKEGFPISRTYNATLQIENLYITYNNEEKTIEIYNVNEDIKGKWYDWISYKDYNDMEIALYIYKLLNK